MKKPIWMMLILRPQRQEIVIEPQSELARFLRDGGSGLKRGFGIVISLYVFFCYNLIIILR